MPGAAASASPLPSQVDIAIVTILPEEYEAVKRRLKNVRRDPGTNDQPNQYAWVVGEIEAAQGGTYQVVLAMTLHPGNTSGSLGTSKTIARWRPRYVLLVGIAGGLPREQLGLGDVVVSRQIVSYEYGKVEHNAFNPRPDFVYQLDGPLLRNALSLREAKWRSKLGCRPGTDGGKSKVLVGMVGAGEKVIDDRGADFFSAVEREFPKLLAVEMEGAGAAAAIQEARDEGRTVGFLMIRGISDMPPDKKTGLKKPAAAKKKDSPAVSDRDQWKAYAARAAASFAVYFISQAWPLPPGGTHQTSANSFGEAHSPHETPPENHVLDYDFGPYLKRILAGTSTSILPNALRTAFDTDLKVLPTAMLHSFRRLEKKDDLVNYVDLFDATETTPVLLIGESGIGKTSLLRQVLIERAQACTGARNNAIPVLIRLGTCTSLRGIESHLLHALSEADGKMTLDKLRGLLRAGRLLLLLDAFDEIFERSLPEVEREIRTLADNYKSTRLIITTRVVRLPRIGAVRGYEIDSLTPERVARILKLQIPQKQVEFAKQLRSRRLDRLTSNTLLLSLLVLLFRKTSNLPASRMLILRDVMGAVSKVEEEKPERFEKPLGWDARIRLLSGLALCSFKASDAYNLDKDSTYDTLRDTLTQLEASREIRAGVSVKEALSSIVSTGFVREEHDGIVFWHRAFLEYFVAVEVARLLDRGKLDLAELLSEVRWAPVLPMAIAMTSELPRFVSAARKLNVFVAAEAITEMGHGGQGLVDEVLPHLRRCCSSELYPIRAAAMDALTRLPGSSVDAVLMELLESGAPGVKISALVEIARRGLPSAREAVYSRLEWEEFDHSSWASGTDAVFQALEEIGDERAQKTVVSMWQLRKEGWISRPASKALSQLARRGLLTSRTEANLVEWFVSDEIDNDYGKVQDLAEVMKAIGTPEVAQRIVDRVVRTGGKRHHHGWPTADVAVLASFEDPTVIQMFADKVCDTGQSPIVRCTFARVLAESVGAIPLDTCLRLSNADEDGFVRAEAVGALARFPFCEIEAVMRRALRDIFSGAEKGQRGHDRLQYEVFEALARHNQLHLLLQDDLKPRVLYRAAFSSLLSAIGAQQVADLIPLVLGFIDRDTNTRLLAECALAFAEVGELDLARRIFKHVLTTPNREQYTETDLFRGAHRLPPDEAIRWVDETWSLVEGNRQSMGAHVSGLYIETLEKIGTKEARRRLVAMALREHGSKVEKEMDLLSSLSALCKLCTTDMEPWLLARLDEARFCRGPARGWVLRMMGDVGAERSAEILVGHLKHSDSSLQNAAFYGLQNIWRRRGRVWFNGEETSD